MPPSTLPAPRRVPFRWLALLLPALCLPSASLHAQSLQRIGRVPADRDVWPDLARLSQQHAAPLLVIANDVYLVPDACQPDAEPDAAAAAPEADAAAPRCVPADDRSGFWVAGAARVERFWYYDRHALRPVHGGFVSFAPSESSAAASRLPVVMEDHVARVNEVNSVFNRGTAAYREGSYAAARDAFARAARLDPHFRDAVFYQLLALERLEDWEAMIPPGERTLELDPLNQSAMLLLARAYNRTLSARTPAALAELDARRTRLAELRTQMNHSPVFFSAGARLDPSCRLQGTLLGGDAPAGGPVSLMVVLRAPSGDEVFHGVQVAAPARGESRELSVALAECGVFGSRMRYRVMTADG